MPIPTGALIRRMLDESGNRLTDESGNRLVDNWYVRPPRTRIRVLTQENRVTRAKRDPRDKV